MRWPVFVTTILPFNLFNGAKKKTPSVFLGDCDTPTVSLNKCLKLAKFKMTKTIKLSASTHEHGVSRLDVHVRVSICPQNTCARAPREMSRWWRA